MHTFKCHDCGQEKPVQHNGGTGYARLADDSDKLICYDCCAIRDRAEMDEKGKAVLYLDYDDTLHSYMVENWPGTLRFKLDDWRRGNHNIAGTRTDVWFRDRAGREWHGVQYGEWSQLCHCKRLKG